MLDMIYYIVVVMIVLLVLYGVASISYAILRSMARSRIGDIFRSVPDFSSDHMLIGHDGQTGLAIDSSRRRLCILTPEPKTLGFDEVLSAAVEEEGSVTMRTSKPSGLIRAAVGGVTLGAAGAVVGAVTANERSVTETVISKISLALNLRSIDAPLYKVTIFESLDNFEWRDPETITATLR